MKALEYKTNWPSAVTYVLILAHPLLVAALAYQGYVAFYRGNALLDTLNEVSLALLLAGFVIYMALPFSAHFFTRRVFDVLAQLLQLRGLTAALWVGRSIALVSYALHLGGFFVIGAALGWMWHAYSGIFAAFAVAVAAVPIALTVFNMTANSRADGQPDSLVQPVGKIAKEEGDASPNYNFDFTFPKAGLDSLAGMSELKGELRSFMQPFKAFKNAKSKPTDRNGLLLSGPPGNGKTAFAEAIAGELGLRFVKVNVSDIASKWVGESPMVLKSLFAQVAQQPTVLFFDEFDAIAASRGGDSHSEDKKVVNSLLALIDDARKGKTVLIAATNFPDAIDPAIARDGRFDFRIEVPYPDLEARVALLTGLLKKHGLQVDASVVQKTAELWERRSVAFIESAVKRLRDAGHKATGRPVTVEVMKAISREAGRKPSAIPKEGPKLNELALPASVRAEADSLIYRLSRWETVAEQGGETPSGVLLYGPPGTGKTAFVRALARQLGDWHVFEVNTTEVLQKPSRFRDLVQKAADHRPAFIFLDEADELLRDRSSSMSAGATNEILKCMDGLMGRVPEVVFIAATNNPEAIDAAAVRGGRFAEKIFMPRLEGEDLVAFLTKEFTRRKDGSFDSGLTPKVLAEELQPIAPADALAVLRKAVSYCFDQNGVRPVSMRDIDRAKNAILA